ncbi:MAG: hypothetical protein QF737_04095, partial [Dehalococcoidales bacterium]|nr:hypothetical protein [Dehalococcoidales bacterium]
SSSGLGHLPLKEETTGSNPVCATKDRFRKPVLLPCFLDSFDVQATFYPPVLVRKFASFYR